MYQNVRGSGYKLFPLRMHLDRQYHCKNGVYGFKPLTKREFKVPQEVVESRNTQGNIYRWIEAHRKFGHKLALVNPISIKPPPRPIDELNPEYYGLKSDEFVNLFGLLSISGSGSTRTATTVEELKSILSGIYCNRRVSAEFDFIQDTEEREWLMEHFEKLTESDIATDRRRQIAELLIKAQAWEKFMAVKFPTVKRYSGEGAESMLAFFWQLLQDAGIRSEIKQIVLGMPHRGRTNLQTLLFNLRPAKVFRKLRGESDFPDNFNAMSDVVSHFHSSQNLFVNKKEIRVSLLRNPSHLEAVNPVAMGKTRSKQQNNGDGSFSDDGVGKAFGTTVLNVLVHGDAAFAGQGINQECLNMAYVPHYDVGGTIHLVVNNQLGFTTPGERACSTDYNTDLAKSIEAPIFHVNGDYPNTVAALTTLAFDYQQKFRKDIFIDLNCYRRWGHNELDDPTFTNPAVYSIIQNRKSVPDLYIENLTSEGVFTVTEFDGIRHKFTEYLNEELQLASSYKPEVTCFQCQWTGLEMAPDAITFWDSGLDYSLLSYIGHQSVAPPDGFKIHPHLMKTHVEARRQRLNSGKKIDWATAEAMAIGSLMYQGFNIRLSGEDVGRGTFSHRHLMLVEQDDNEMYIPLNDLKGGNEGKLEIAHSILSEEAVLGFEYGMAIDNPNNLIIWEAQFGDFANAAQIIIDNFIVSGETKWLNSNGLVLLLPHGYDGAASEHSSCRIERFLQLCDSKETKPDGDNVNVHIVNPTTPAQYFHVLRRQMLRNFRKPLVVVAPKILLRLSAATSDHTDFCPGTFFQNVLGDQNVDSNYVKRIILCSGKHYYSLMEERTTKDISDTAIIRLESLCPFPLSELQQELAKFKKVKSFIWSQEEHRNMGAWNFVRPRFEYLIGEPLRYSGREEAATNATGVGNIHKKESIEIVENPFKL